MAVEFPDLPGCATFGTSEAEAVARAKEALEGFLYYSERDGDVIPAPTPFDKVQVRPGEAVSLVSVRMDIVREEEANKSVTKSVTLPN
ncbi:MAG: type II toxin-antitoxin system HicB family antitoxin [Aminobacteriaceae bacterium]